MVPPAVEVSGPLPEEGAVGGAALLGGPEPLEALLDDGRVLPVVVGVHLDVRGADVHLVAGPLDAVVVGLLPVVPAAGVAIRAVVARRVPHEAVLQRLVPLLVPLEVTDHLLLLHEYPGVAVQAVEVLPGRKEKGPMRLEFEF